MRPIMLRWVARLSMEVGLPVSATNGVWSWQDIVKAVMCGASTVQTCTAVMYSGKGFAVMSEFLEGLERYCEESGLASLDAVRGLTLPQIKTAPEVEKPEKGTVWATVDAELCRGCRRPVCANSCFHGAVALDSAGKASVVKEKCEGCGLCALRRPLLSPRHLHARFLRSVVWRLLLERTRRKENHGIRDERNRTDGPGGVRTHGIDHLGFVRCKRSESDPG